MERQGTKHVDLVGAGDKRLITAVFCGSLVDDFLPIQVIYAGKTTRCHPRYEFPSNCDITHSPKRWSNEATTIQYIRNIIIPYINNTRDGFKDDTPALIIMDNFKGQVTSVVTNLLEENNIHVCLLPANTTDRLQPMDLTVNKPAKDFLKRCFGDWYAEQIRTQLEGNDIESTDLQPINLGLPALKELGAKWMVEMAQYFADNPQIIVNGLIKAESQEHWMAKWTFRMNQRMTTEMTLTATTVRVIRMTQGMKWTYRWLINNYYFTMDIV